MKTKHQAWVAAAAAILVALPAFSQTLDVGPDERILWFIHQSDLYESEVARLATARSGSASVRKLAAQMLADQNAEEEQVRAYAGRHGVDLDALRAAVERQNEDRLEYERRVRAIGSATGEFTRMLEQPSRSADERRTLDSLAKLSGAEFDRRFVDAVVDGDGREIDRFERIRHRPSVSPDLRELIDGLRPAVQHQLDEAKALQDVISKG